jgi:hypothetical protein
VNHNSDGTTSGKANRGLENLQVAAAVGMARNGFPGSGRAHREEKIRAI